jgi:flagellar hook-associated protein 3 FlgL
MRISTSTLFDSSLARMTSLQSKIDRTSQQLGADKKILTAGDDPAAATQVIELQQSAARNDQYARNRTNLKNSLMSADGAMSGMADALQTIHEQVIGAGNAALSDSERGAIAKVLQVQYDQILSLANTQDSAGNYLFSGHQTAKPPFVADAEGNLSYQGDLNQQFIPVDSSRKVAVNEPGSTLLPEQDGANIFSRLKDAISALQPDQAAETRAQALAALGSSSQVTLDSVTSSQVTIGIKLNDLDQLDTQGSDRGLRIADATSSLQDLDYVAALSDLSLQKMTLEIAQKAFQQVSRLSLFNYLN